MDFKKYFICDSFTIFLFICCVKNIFFYQGFAFSGKLVTVMLQYLFKLTAWICNKENLCRTGVFSLYLSHYFPYSMLHIEIKRTFLIRFKQFFLLIYFECHNYQLYAFLIITLNLCSSIKKLTCENQFEQTTNNPLY